MGFQENAEALGGADNKVKEGADKISCNTLHHFLRSLAHQPNHIKHFGEVVGPSVEVPDSTADSRISKAWFTGHRPVVRARNQK